MTKLIDAGAGLRFPAVVQDEGSYGDYSVDVEFVATFNPASELYEIKRLTVIGSEPITGTILRRVRVQEAFGEVMRKTTFGLQGGGEYRLPYPDRVTYEDGHLEWEPVPSIPLNKREAEAARRVHAERLFVIARAFGQPELKLIQEVLGVSQSTASRLLKQEASTNE